MKLYEGFTLVSLTDTEIVQEKSFGPTGKGKIIFVGNPNPDPVKRQQIFNECGEILAKGEARRLLREERERKEREAKEAEISDSADELAKKLEIKN